MTEARRPTLLCVGDLNLDLVITPEVPIATGSDVAGAISMSAGGSAANVAAWAVAASQRAVDVRFIGTVGDDATGPLLAADLATAGVDARLVVRGGARSRTVAVIVDGSGNRSMISDLDPRIALRQDDLADPATVLAGVDHLHLTGYSFVSADTRPLFLDLVARATAAGIPWSVDPSSAELLRACCPPAEARAAFAGAAVVFPSHDEAAYLVDGAAPDDDPAAMAEELLSIASCVVVTCGPDGAWVARRDQPTRHVAATPTQVVNTLGAGDAFAAGFLVAELTGADPGRAGADTAALAVARATAH